MSFIGLLLLVIACNRDTEEDPTQISGSGNLEGEEIVITSELGGKIIALEAATGDTVSAGSVLVRLDDTDVNLQIAAAQAQVAMAAANLAQVRAGARPAEVDAAEAAVESALADAEGATSAVLTARRAITEPLTLDLQIAEARMARDLAEQTLAQANAELEAEQLDYHIYVDLKENVSADTRRSWDLRIQAAEQQIARAAAELDAAQATLNALYAQRNTPLVAQAELHAAEAAYTATLAAVDAARADLAGLEAGPQPAAVAIAEAQLLQARAALTLTLLQRELLTLTAPGEGIVATRSYHVGEQVPPGLPILTLVNLDTIYLTLYVPETRIGAVKPGQRVTVQVTPYPGESFTGEVTQIAAEAEYTPGSVETEGDRARRVFAVEVRLPNPDQRLRPGLPAQATIETAP